MFYTGIDELPRLDIPGRILKASQRARSAGSFWGSALLAATGSSRRRWS